MVEKTNLKTAPLVLVVDDDDTTRMLAEMSLTKAGFAVAEAEDGDLALEALVQVRPDIIMLDVDMPGLDGFETCARLRARPDHRITPVVMMTAHKDQVSIDRAYAVGATDFISKPINWGLLCYRLRYILRANNMMVEFARSKDSLARAQRTATIGSWDWNVNREEMTWSDEFFRILAVARDEAPAVLETLLERVRAPDKERVQRWFTEALRGVPMPELVHKVVRPGAYERIVQHKVESTTDSSGEAFICGTVQDITELQHAAERIRRLAYFDGLTGLPNRESFSEHLSKSIAHARRYGRAMAVLFLDLDDFKRVNDTLGHNTGDLLLKEVADRVRDAVRSSDSMAYMAAREEDEPAARLGGDEFAVILSELRRADDAATVAERIVERLSQSFRLNVHEIFTTASVGISVYPRDGEDAESLLKHADAAMYSAKRGGKNRYEFFDEAMNIAAQRRLSVDSQMRKALENGEFFLLYQPQMDVPTGQIDGVEALLRWQNPQLGLLSPIEFIPLAEENGLIIPIGDWVLQTACAQMKLWREQDVGLSRIAVNISVLQFVHKHFVERLGQILKDTGLDPEYLELEITESLLAKDVEGAVIILDELKRLGVQISIDDFGTGYSSLNYLKSFPVDRLKIDRSFIKDILSSPDDDAIVSAVIGMAASLRLGVVAEGVETEAQLGVLRSKNCDEIQGYFLSRPIPAEELPGLCRKEGIGGS